MNIKFSLIKWEKKNIYNLNKENIMNSTLDNTIHLNAAFTFSNYLLEDNLVFIERFYFPIRNFHLPMTHL